MHPLPNFGLPLRGDFFGGGEWVRVFEWLRIHKGGQWLRHCQVPALSPDSILYSSFPQMSILEGSGEGPWVWVPATPVGDLDWVPMSWLAAGIWGVNQPQELSVTPIYNSYMQMSKNRMYLYIREWIFASVRVGNLVVRYRSVIVCWMLGTVYFRENEGLEWF